MSDPYPDDIARIVELRAQGVLEREIAARLGIKKKTLWSRVARWNKANPDRRLPRPKRRPELRFYEQAAQMLKDGMTTRQIADHFGRPITTVAGWVDRARKHGVAPPKTTRLDEGGATAHRFLRQKGAAPPLGSMSDTLALLDKDEILRLVDSARRDETVADVIARIVKEHLDADTQGR